MAVAGHRSRSAAHGRIRLLVAVTAVMAASVIGPSGAFAVERHGAAGPDVGVLASPGPTKPGYSQLISNDAVLQPGLSAGSGRHTVFVQLATRGAAAVSATALAQNLGAASVTRAVREQQATTRAMSADVFGIAKGVDPSAVTTFEVANAVPGIGLTADSAALRVLAGRGDVVKISEIVPKTPADAGTAQLTRVLQTWTDLGVTGRGERIGVIDTGIDYTHADFGGPGIVAAYRTARSTDAAAWAPTAKVVGGYDFAGDDYDAAATTAAGTVNPGYQPVPHPDSNPLDCNGHGTHVAGTVAGAGVDSDGRTFAGDYRELTGGALDSMDVGPGMAPQASLYALKVFGCSGATDLVIPALDWALDPNGDGDFSDHLDVVDLSLADPIGGLDDPETTVLDAIAEYGVVPVVAAGNGGDETDAAGSLTGSVRSIAVASSVDAHHGQLAGQPSTDNSITDLIQTSSARGTHGSQGPVKPDVSAPGDTISSALMGSGSGVSVRSGTSMAAAEIAGVAALVRQGHPWWTPEQVKAAVMNTAGHDLYKGPNRTGAVVGPDRAGAGRVDVASALSAQVLAYSSSTPGAVSVTFGVVPADVRQATVVVTSAVVVQNTGLKPVDLALSYQAVVDQPGVAYQVSPATMTLAAGASALATVTMTVTPAALRHTLDPGRPAQQTNPLTGLDEARQFVPAASGRVLLAAPGVPALRVPVYGAAKPVSATTAVDGTAAGHPALVVSGTGFSLSSPADPARSSYRSLVSVLDLGYRRSAVPDCAGSAAAVDGPTVPATTPPAAVAVGTNCPAGDHGNVAGEIQAVGAGRTGVDGSDPGYLWFGLDTSADWATAGKNMFPTVNIDTNGDNTADYTVQVQTIGGSDLLYALLFDDAGAGSLIGIYPVNFNLGNVDTNPFDTNVMLIPIDPTALGYRATDTTFPIRYSVATSAAYGAPLNSGTIDTTPAIDFDLARPAISMSAPLWQDQGGTGIPYRLGAGVASANALLLHLQGADGARAQVVTVSGGSG